MYVTIKDIIARKRVLKTCITRMLWTLKESYIKALERGCPFH